MKVKLFVWFNLALCLLYPITLQAAYTADGWTRFIPTPLDESTYPRTHAQQPGTRILYISKQDSVVTPWDNTATYSSGAVVMHPNTSTAVAGDIVTSAFWQATGSPSAGVAPSPGVAGWSECADPGVVYYWNGRHVVDATGTTYGSDPFNPEGVSTFFSYGMINASTSAWGHLRDGFADWCLFKRGETWTAGVDQFRGFLGYAGKNTNEMMLHSAYGSIASERPRFLHNPGGITDQYGNHPSNFISISFNGEPTRGHFAFVSMTFEPLDPAAADRGHGLSISGSWQGLGIVDNILLEDIKVNGFSGNVLQWLAPQNDPHYLPFNFNIALRRCVIINTWHGVHHNQGLYIDMLNNLSLEDCFFDRNGYNVDPRTDDTERDIFSRNFYLNHYNQMGVAIYNTISCNGGSGGPQMRCGGLMEQSLVLNEGYWYSGAYGDLDWVRKQVGTSSIIRNNVMFKWRSIGTTDDRSHPGWGFHIQSQAFRVNVYDNIITGQHMILNSQSETPYAFKFIGSDDPAYFCTLNRVHNNIAYLAGGLEAENTSGLHGNAFSSNVVATNQRCVYHEGISDTVFSGNRYYTDQSEPFRTDSGNLSYADFISANVCQEHETSTVAPLDRAASAEGWPDPDRSVKSYMESLGYTITTADGVREFMQECYQQRKGYWRPEFTARAVVNYVREGFGLAAVLGYPYGLEARLANKKVITYPNPAHDRVNFLLQDISDSGEAVVHIYNFNGECIARLQQQITVLNPTLVWHSAQAAPGVYLARILFNGKKWAQVKIALIE